ncbi:TetR/AcrR family transcriptional regulator [Nonomuraea sp. NN258]|uniref:TetR/AcrR family transcriptional regulator C-terminal domain-containing protein n=1 Tax=Nonomuraea antri TaxID=2730852 RepID=UPI0015689F29|nr:TetR/AcrR family transcriptional regulator C-terminal domain-containing protein [Nonomuraea antri]NRQ30461.1 TetR/AcrR family transcriptional regulator [Nonomuraea antri]
MALSLREDRTGGSVDHFLALLQDRLPLWLSILHNLSHRIGRGQVSDNLLPVARAGIDYYLEVQGAALPAFTSPNVTVRFREAVRETGLGPPAEIAPLAAYLAAEQELGRVAPDVDPEASARLLLAGCFHRAYIEMFVGADAGPTRADSAEEIVRELRLEPVHA